MVQPVPHGSAPIDHMPRCGAKSKRSGQSCKAPAMANGRCQMHGGKALRGVAHPNFKGGPGARYLDSIPISLRESYEIASSDPELLNLTAELSLVQARVHEILGKLHSTQDSALLIKGIKSEWKNYKRALRNQDTPSANEAMSELNRLIAGAEQEWMVWEDLYKALTKLQSLARQEQKRRIEMHNLVSTDEVVAFASEVMYVVKENVSDPKALMAIREGVRSALERRPSMAKAAG